MCNLKSRDAFGPKIVRTNMDFISMRDRFQRFMKISFTMVLLLFVISVSPLLSERSWTERATGKVIQAEYVSCDGKTVVLRMKGRRAEIELSRLSDKDREFVAEQMRPVAALPDASEGPYREFITGEFAHAQQALAENGLPLWLFGTKQMISGDQAYPLVIVLHGRRNNAKPEDEFKPQSIATPFAKDGNQKQNPCFVVQPYYPPKGGWEKIPEKLDATVAHLMAHLPIDSKRVYLMGFSNGAQGTFQTLARDPERYAAALTVSGPVSPKSVVGKIKAPIRAWVGENDHDLNKNKRCIELAGALKASGLDIELVVVKGAGHSCHHVPLRDVEVHAWLFSQTRP